MCTYGRQKITCIYDILLYWQSKKSLSNCIHKYRRTKPQVATDCVPNSRLRRPVITYLTSRCRDSIEMQQTQLAFFIYEFLLSTSNGIILADQYSAKTSRCVFSFRAVIRLPSDCSLIEFEIIFIGIMDFNF